MQVRRFASIRAINAVMLQTGNYVWIGPSHGNAPDSPDIYIVLSSETNQQYELKWCIHTHKNYQPSLRAHTHGNGKSDDSFCSEIIFSEIPCNHIAPLKSFFLIPSPSHLNSSRTKRLPVVGKLFDASPTPKAILYRRKIGPRNSWDTQPQHDGRFKRRIPTKQSNLQATTAITKPKCSNR